MAAVAKISPYRKRQEGVALFIDWENLKISLQTIVDAEPDVQTLLEVVDNYGQRGVSRAYADWQNYGHLHDDQTRLLMRSVETVQILGRNPDTQSPIKNSADVALAVEATRTCYRHPDLTTFVLVTGDGDLVHLVNELKRNRNRVVIVGVGGAVSRLLREAADEVLIYEQDVEPHLSKIVKSDLKDIDTVLEGIKTTLAENNGQLSLAALGRMMGRKGISLRSSNYSLGELSDILVKRGEIERVDQGDSPYLRLRRHRHDARDSRNSSDSRNNRRGNYKNNNHDNRRAERRTPARAEQSTQAQPRNKPQQDTKAEVQALASTPSEIPASTETPTRATPANAWQALPEKRQQEFLGSIYALEQRSPFITPNYLLEHLHQTFPEYKKGELESISNALQQEHILQHQRQGSGRDGRTIITLNYDHDAVDDASLQAAFDEQRAAETSAPAPAVQPNQSNIASDHGNTLHKAGLSNAELSNAGLSKNEKPSGDALNNKPNNAPDIHEDNNPNNTADNPHIIRALPRDKEALWQFLQQAEADKTVLEVIPELDDTGELQVLLLDDAKEPLYARLPKGQLEFTRSDDASSYANKPIDVHVLNLDSEEGEIVLSRRGVLARRMVEPETLQREISLGREFTAQVVSVNDYAAFIDLGGATSGGVRGFVHRSEIADPEPKKASDVLTIGDIVVAKPTSLDWNNRRLQFSIKQARQRITPTVNTPHLTQDDDVKNDVTASPPHTTNQAQRTPAFAPVNTSEQATADAITQEISQPIASDTRTQNVHNLSSSSTPVPPADTQHHIQSTTELLSDAYPEALASRDEASADASSADKKTVRPSWRDLKERYPQGRVVTGEVNNVLDYGAFITLEDGYSALLHKNELQALSLTPEENKPEELVAVGNHVDVIIKSHNDARKHLILGLAESEKQKARAHATSTQTTSVQTASTQTTTTTEDVDTVLLADVSEKNTDDFSNTTARQARSKGMKLLGSLRSQSSKTVTETTASTVESIEASGQNKSIGASALPTLRSDIPLDDLPLLDATETSPAAATIAPQDLPLLDTPEDSKTDDTVSEASISPASDNITTSDETRSITDEASDATSAPIISEEGDEKDNLLTQAVDVEQDIILHTTDFISHHKSTYVPLTEIYHSLEQKDVHVDPTHFKNALVRAHQGRKLRIVRHPENRGLYAGLGVHTDDDISDILL